jgi:hypothetical protein
VKTCTGNNMYQVLAEYIHLYPIFGVYLVHSIHVHPKFIIPNFEMLPLSSPQPGIPRGMAPNVSHVFGGVPENGEKSSLNGQCVRHARAGCFLIHVPHQEPHTNLKNVLCKNALCG